MATSLPGIRHSAEPPVFVTHFNAVPPPNAAAESDFVQA